MSETNPEEPPVEDPGVGTPDNGDSPPPPPPPAGGGPGREE